LSEIKKVSLTVQRSLGLSFIVDFTGGWSLNVAVLCLFLSVTPGASGGWFEFKSYLRD
jgi:hypothetical protein